MIEVKNLTIKKGRKTIIEDVNLNIQAGRVYVVIGRNGAGKTTLLESLARLESVEHGTINWDRIASSKLNLQLLSRRRAVLSQQVKIDFPITVGELVEMGVYVADENLSQTKIESLVYHGLREVEMLGFINRNFNTLSGGEQKRVLLAKCIVQLNCCHWADINKYIFLDEPTASLDIQQQYKLIELIKRIVKRRKVGVFAVLHDINLAAQFADEILIMNSGKLLYKGSPKKILTAKILKETLGIHSIVQPHPVFGCPHITTLPHSVELTA